jgi:signal transduction histidine kinase
MKISTRIAIVFSMISSVILIVFGISVYLYSKSNIENSFFNRLSKRVDITENYFLEKGSFSTLEFDKIKTQFSHTLNEEYEEIIKINTFSKATFKYYYPKKVKNRLLNSNNLMFRYGKRQGASKVFKIENNTYLVIVTAQNLNGYNDLSFLLKGIMYFILLGIPILFILFFIITKKTLRPISKKIDRANKISATNLHERLEVINPKDEIGQTAIAFNRMLDRLEKSFESQKSFISNVSHEIRNPLTAIMGEAEIASSQKRSEAEYQKSFSIILTESERLNSTLTNLLQLSKISVNESSVKMETILFDSFIYELKENFTFVNPEHNILLQFPQSSENIDYEISGNKNLLKTAILNVFDNACKYSSNKIVMVNLLKGNDFITLSVLDKGIGIPQKELPTIGSPFSRASNSFLVKGSGIGLSLTKKIITLHEGKLSIESIEGKETKVNLILPIEK